MKKLLAVEYIKWEDLPSLLIRGSPVFGMSLFTPLWYIVWIKNKPMKCDDLSYV